METRSPALRIAYARMADDRRRADEDRRRHAFDTARDKPTSASKSVLTRISAALWSARQHHLAPR